MNALLAMVSDKWTGFRMRKERNYAAIQRRAQLGVVIMGKSIGGRGDDSLTPTTGVGNYYSERELREEFSTLIADYTPRQIANASGCTIDAAKKWLAGKSLPNTASTFNMGRRLKVVRDWAEKKIGTAADAQMRALRDIVREEVGAQIEKRPPAPSIDIDPRQIEMFKRRA